ncbi:MAG: biotin--[acetyl-CoA-carboxylase] ligase [Dehalococcoidia bacterium]|nr:biotin--[acetyl-CoA-carboxylase] ligase [Dehalococcoidia bacterium]MDW8119206.1 biotin--[acetyl-CoA-carboxylase] ligase [Chloroflexota bacterium]
MSRPLSLPDVARGLGTRLIGTAIYLFPRITSTMDAAYRLAQVGAPEGVVVLAEEQTAGRGRFQRAWVSPPGHNLYLSIILRPPAEALRRVNMACSLAVVDTVQKVAGLTPRVKWPNDVRLGGKKVCGILIEGRWEDPQTGWVVAGIGLNVNATFIGTPLADIATSLAQEVGHPLDRGEVLRRLLQALDSRYQQALDRFPLWKEWNHYLEGLGKPVAVQWGGDTVEGMAQGVTPDGDLVVLQDNGTTVVLPAGEVTTRVSAHSA